MDSLSELVRLLAPAGTVDLHCRVAGAWSAHNEQAPPGHVPYHVILDGQASVQVGKETLQVGMGDVLLFRTAPPIRCMACRAAGAGRRSRGSSTGW
jgi:AraC family transcriptional activator of mtrCDE